MEFLVRVPSCVSGCIQRGQRTFGVGSLHCGMQGLKSGCQAFLAVAFALWAILPVSFWSDGYFLHFLCVEVLEHSDKDVWDGQVKGRRVCYGCLFQSIVLSGKASCHDRPGSRETGTRTFTFPPLRCLGLRQWDDTTHVQLVLETHTKCTQRFDSSRGFWVQPRWLEISPQILLHVLENYASGLLGAVFRHWALDRSNGMGSSASFLSLAAVFLSPFPLYWWFIAVTDILSSTVSARYLLCLYWSWGLGCS